MVKKAFMTVQAGDKALGELPLILYNDECPKTVANFVHFLQQRKAGKGYLHSTFHRNIKGFMIQGGDFLRGDGTGTKSLYGETFEDENFIHRHDKRGLLSMANSGPDSNGSQFFITYRPTPHLNGKHVVFGHVDLTTNPDTKAVLNALEASRTGTDDRPLVPLKIVGCGVRQEQAQENQKNDAGDGNEIYLDDDEDEKAAVPDDNGVELPVVEEEEEEEEGPPKTKAEALRQRMRKLKLKMNQARQLNKQEVLKEGERLGSVEGATKARKRQQMQDKKAQEAEWKARNSKALEVAKASGVDGKYLVEQADTSIQKATRKQDKAVAHMYSANDFHNPQGMHRNYERSLKSVPRSHGEGDGAEGTFDPTMNPADEAREREGARGLANELKRREVKAEKTRKRRERTEFEGEDVTYINQRNKRFNQKISRNYDKHTAEIRQNLERGTAL